MRASTRGGIIAASIALAVLAFVLLKPDDEPSRPAATTDTRATAARATPTPTPGSEVTTIRFRAGKPVGGVKKITVRNGETVRFVAGADVTDEVHLHGYDISRPVAPGKDARFRFTAKLEGIFEVELEERGAPIASLEVRP